MPKNQELAQCASGGPMQLQLAEEASRQGGVNVEGLLWAYQMRH